MVKYAINRVIMTPTSDVISKDSIARVEKSSLRGYYIVRCCR